jgi:hypothetical protein
MKAVLLYMLAGISGLLAFSVVSYLALIVIMVHQGLRHLG